MGGVLRTVSGGHEDCIAATAQSPRAYPVMASALLPTVWSGKSLSALQLGLARALAQYFDLPAEAATS